MKRSVRPLDPSSPVTLPSPERQQPVTTKTPAKDGDLKASYTLRYALNRLRHWSAWYALVDSLRASIPVGLGQAPPSVQPALLTALAQEAQRDILWVTPNSDNAERLFQDLSVYLGEKAANRQIRLFPEKEVQYDFDNEFLGDNYALPEDNLKKKDNDEYLDQLIPDDFQEQNTANPAQPSLSTQADSADPLRLSVLHDLNQRDHQPLIIIAPVRALLQPTVRQEKLAKSEIILKTGEEIDLEDLIELLSAEGYKRVAMVEHRGELARRGCILDIFPITGSPVRAEFFGDEIESLRLLDTDSQRSIEAVPQGQVSLLPAQADQNDTEWLTDYLRAGGEQAWICLEDPNLLNLSIHEWFQEWHSESSDDALGALLSDMLEDFPRLSLCSWKLEQEARMDKLADPGHSWNLPLGTPPQYAGQVSDLLKGIPDLLKSGCDVLVLTRQYSRLQELMREAGLPVREPAILDNSHSISRTRSQGDLILAQGYVSEGFVLNPRDMPQEGGPTPQEFSGGDLVLITDHEITGQRRQRKAVRQNERESSLRLDELHPGDLVVHAQHGIGRYLGIETQTILGIECDMVQLEYAKGDIVSLPVGNLDLVHKYKGVDELAPSLSKLGGQEWSRTKAKVQAQVEEIAQELIDVAAKRRQIPGFAYSADGPWEKEMEEAFPYRETPDQLNAINEVKQDMQKPYPMDRLVCGDVGYGKTEVALRAAFKAAMAGRQILILTPTTVLAHQHYLTFCERLAPFPVRIRLLSRAVTPKQQKIILQELADGEADIIIGTHRLLSKDVQAKNLGLIIVDEEHKFGVKHKEKLKSFNIGVDILTMSATPIPRTLQLAMYNLREMSLIETPPEERLPIKTYLFNTHPDLIKAAITREISRQGQVFFVHNRVYGLERIAQDLRRLLPQARIATAHGQMTESRLEKVMMEFYEGQYDVLVCTTIIESGLDIPNVNTMIINNANMFGLAQLYQLRGRVGRSVKQGYCYLLTQPARRLTKEAQQRLETIRDFTHLGAGFQIARRDLEIRGAGNILGTQQSGNVALVGFDLYCRLLSKAVAELNGEKVEEEDSEQSVTLELPIPSSLPESYISDPLQKMALYRRMANLKTSQDVEDMRAELRDRFGTLPQESENLLQMIIIRQKAYRMMIPAIRIQDSFLYIVMPFSRPLGVRERYLLCKACGWECKHSGMTLTFLGLYGKAAGHIEYPPAPEMLEKLNIILDTLQGWHHLRPTIDENV